MITRYVLSAITILGAAYTFWVFSAVCVLGMILVMHYVPETKDIPLEEIEMNLKDGFKRRCLGQRREQLT